MRRSDGIRLAADALLGHPLRTFLTLLGISIGVTAIIAVASVINGLDLFITRTLTNLGPGVFVVHKYGVITSREEWLRARRRNPSLKMSDARAIRRNVALAAKVGMSLHKTGAAKRGAEILEDIEIRGITPEVIEIEPLDIAFGRTFARSHERGAAPVAILGWDVAENLFGALDPIGRTLRITGRGFRTVGVAAKQGSVFGVSRDNFVIIPISTFRRMFGSGSSVRVSVQVADPVGMDEAIDETRAVLRARHHLAYDEPDDFGIITAEGIQNLWERFTRILFRVALFVVGIALVVGGIVIMNIMLLSVIERTREIGIRKAVGARQRDIEQQFLNESAMLSVAGGVIGVGLGWLASWAVATFTAIPASLPLWAPIVAVLLAGSVGIFFGIYPARRAAALDPIESLRFEES